MHVRGVSRRRFAPTARAFHVERRLVRLHRGRLRSLRQCWSSVYSRCSAAYSAVYSPAKSRPCYSLFQSRPVGDRVFLRSLSVLVLVLGLPCIATPLPAVGDELEEGFRAPPAEARCRVYWWWLNSNVTKESITQDLEAMHKQGIGGALLFDTDNETFRKNRLVPHGPDFGSAEYRALFAHACKEADRRGIELSFLIQSGWNLGGPSVTPEEGAKLVTWNETQIDSNKPIDIVLPKPKSTNGFYRDIAVLAYPQANPQLEDRSPITYTVSADWVEPGRDPSLAADGDLVSYWCTDGHKPGDGPTPDRPNWLLMKFSEPITATNLEVIGRKGYGPKSCELQVRQGKGEYRTVKKFEMKDKIPADVHFDPATGDSFRLMFYTAYDAGYPDNPAPRGGAGNRPAQRQAKLAPCAPRNAGRFGI